jgi:hypothetical protein
LVRKHSAPGPNTSYIKPGGTFPPAFLLPGETNHEVYKMFINPEDLAFLGVLAAFFILFSGR